jgi:exoribonuclease R
MFDKSTLSQLKGLKKQIEDSREFGNGIVKGTERRFGFVVLDDEREIFLTPDEMDKVFPGDEVNIQIHTSKEGKVSGELLNVINTPLKTFAGRYVIKGKGHFVEPDLPRFKRWIFIPPAARNGAENGDYIYCNISRHAYPAAKPQAKVLNIIGKDSSVGIEAIYSATKFEWMTHCLLKLPTVAGSLASQSPTLAPLYPLTRILIKKHYAAPALFTCRVKPCRCCPNYSRPGIALYSLIK